MESVSWARTTIILERPQENLARRFYNMEDGYIPCRPPIECGMPGKWFAEFERPLGPPEGPATNTGFVWRRAFEHASVYVDLEDREACNITWH
jgi:hypothetical protein